MVMTYDLNRANGLIELFSNNKIVTLKIYLDNSLGEDAESYIFDFKTIEDYPENKRIEIRSLFNEKNLQRLNQITKILKEFVAANEVDAVSLFELSFDITTDEFKMQKAYKQGAVFSVGPVVNNNFGYQDMLSALEKYIASEKKLNVDIPEVYEKSPSTNKQTRAKYTQITLGYLLNKMKEVKINDNNIKRD